MRTRRRESQTANSDSVNICRETLFCFTSKCRTDSIFGKITFIAASFCESTHTFKCCIVLKYCTVNTTCAHRRRAVRRWCVLKHRGLQPSWFFFVFLHETRWWAERAARQRPNQTLHPLFPPSAPVIFKKATTSWINGAIETMNSLVNCLLRW